MLKVVNRTGLATDSRNLQKKYKGFLAISVPKKAFTKDLVIEIAEYGNSICKEFVVVLVDYPERWNWILRDKKSKAETTENSVRLGVDKKNGYVHALKKAGLNGEVQVWSWLRFIEEAKYQKNLEVMASYFQSSRAFREKVMERVKKNIGGKIFGAEKCLGRKLNEQEFHELAHYLLEEVAGLFYLCFDLDYKIDIYPGSDASFFEKTCAEEFPELMKQLGYNWSKRGFIEITHTDMYDKRMLVSTNKPETYGRAKSRY